MILNTHLPSRYQNHNRPFPTSKVVSYSTPPLIPCFPLLCFLSTSKRDISSTSLYFSISPYTALILLIASHVWAIYNSRYARTTILPADRVPYYPNHHRRAPSWCQIWVARSSWEYRQHVLGKQRGVVKVDTGRLVGSKSTAKMAVGRRCLVAIDGANMMRKVNRNWSAERERAQLVRIVELEANGSA